MYEDDKPKKRKVRKPGQWGPLDLIFALVAVIVIGALTVAAFKTAKWAWQTFF